MIPAYLGLLPLAAGAERSESRLAFAGSESLSFSISLSLSLLSLCELKVCGAGEEVALTGGLLVPPFKQYEVD